MILVAPRGRPSCKSGLCVAACNHTGLQQRPQEAGLGLEERGCGAVGPPRQRSQGACAAAGTGRTAVFRPAMHQQHCTARLALPTAAPPMQRPPGLRSVHAAVNNHQKKRKGGTQHRRLLIWVIPFESLMAGRRPQAGFLCRARAQAWLTSVLIHAQAVIVRGRRPVTPSTYPESRAGTVHAEPPSLEQEQAHDDEGAEHEEEAREERLRGQRQRGKCCDRGAIQTSRVRNPPCAQSTAGIAPGAAARA